MKQTLFPTGLCLLFSARVLAQKERFSYQSKLFQASIRTGLLNSELNVQYRLSPKTIVAADIGIGVVYVHSHYYNRFTENYAGYDKYYDDFVNFGWNWWSTYTAVQVRRIVSSRSKIKYRSAPYANTYFYYALQLKRNSRELQGWADNAPVERFRETYQMGVLLGRQAELNKAGNIVFDFYFGLGALANYNLAQVQPKGVMGTRIGWNFWRVND